MCCAQRVGERPENLKGRCTFTGGEAVGLAGGQSSGRQNGIDKFCANTAMCCAQRVGERPENLKARRTVTGGEAVGYREKLAGGQSRGRQKRSR